MNKDCKIWTAALCICCFCACTGEDSIPTTPDGGKGVPIGFTVDESTTRAQLTTAENMNSMALFAYHTTGNFNAVTATPNYMFNTPVNKVNGVWISSPTFYWPGADADRLSFFAITPVPTEDNGITVTMTATTPGCPAFKIAPPTSPTQQADFCIATPVLNATYDAPNGGASTPAAEADKGKVPLAFAHAMTKIRFSASYTTSSSYSGDDISAWVESIELTGVVGSGKVQLAQDGKYAWSENTGTSGNYKLTLAEGALTNMPLSTTASLLSTEIGALCLIPQTIPAGAQFKVVIRTAGETEVCSCDIPLTEGYEWKAGASLNYNPTITDIDSKLNITAGNPQPTTWDYVYAGKKAQLFLAPQDGTYKIEIWGNQGGNFQSVKDISGGKGGYTSGEIELTKGDFLKIYVGECNYSNNYVKGWNGGGCAGSGGRYPYCSPGGGSIDVRFKKIAGNYGFNNLDVATDADPLTGLTGNEATDPRIIVGGGGGFGANDGDYMRFSYGGYAGGETGGDSNTTTRAYKGPHPGGKGGTQTGGGISDRGNAGYTVGLTDGVAGCGGHTGKNGGGDGSASGGGGGGWFGGGSGSWESTSAGGGGSSHVHSTLFTNPVLKAGNEAFTSPTGGNETGHTGAGLVRITFQPAPDPADL